LSETENRSRPASALGSFAELVAAGTPTPGGGSVAAYCGALATALGRLMCNITLGKSKYAAVEDEVGKINAGLEQLETRFRRLIDEDAAAFDSVLAAYRLARDTDEQKSERNRRIQEAFQTAATVPLETARAARESLVLMERLSGIGSSNALPDLAVAGRMAETAIRGAYYNVAVNLKSIIDQEFSNRLGSEIRTLLDEAAARAGRIESAFLSSLK
jgi:formiminotetrahydrofolate cyclodeaminase